MRLTDHLQLASWRTWRTWRVGEWAEAMWVASHHSHVTVTSPTSPGELPTLLTDINWVIEWLPRIMLYVTFKIHAFVAEKYCFAYLQSWSSLLSIMYIMFKALQQGSSTFWVRGSIYIFLIILRAAVIADYRIIMDVLIIIGAWAARQVT